MSNVVKIAFLLLLILCVWGCSRSQYTESYKMKTSNIAEEDTVCLRFVGHSCADYWYVSKRYYHGDTSTIVLNKIKNYGSSTGISFKTKGRKSCSGGKGEYFDEAIKGDTVLLLYNGEQLACWTKENIDDTRHNIYDINNWNFEHGHGYHGEIWCTHTFTIDKTDIDTLLLESGL